VIPPPLNTSRQTTFGSSFSLVFFFKKKKKNLLFHHLKQQGIEKREGRRRSESVGSQKTRRTIPLQNEGGVIQP
jgi:hypothetical protein